MTAFMHCPDCTKRGVQLRLRPRGEDHWGCRYCSWSAYCDSWDFSDRSGRERLRTANLDHPERPAYEEVRA